jgi:chromatin assembly factor 1 subunit B
VWSVESGSVHAVLAGHGSFLKGVAWDPIDSYVATLGEDRAVRLWSSETWACVVTVEKSLEHMSLHTLFCRCVPSLDVFDRVSRHWC